MERSRPKLISSIVIVIAIIWGSYEASNWLYFTSLEEEAANHRGSLVELKGVNDENEKIKENAGQLETALQDAEHRYDSLKPLLPTEAELPRIFDWIANRAVERNLKLEHFSQGTQIKQQGMISEIPIQVNVLGYYDGVERFLEDFSRFERVLRVHGVHMFQEEQQLSPLATVHADINFSAYITK